MAASRVAAREVPAGTLVATVVAAAAAAAVGVWIDWVWWNPVYGVQVIALGIALVAAIVGLAVRRRGVAGGVLSRVGPAVLIGLLLGFVLGPSRPAVAGDEGTFLLRLSAPTALEIAGAASCSHTDDDSAYQLSGDLNARIPVDGEPFIQVSFVAGDQFVRGGTRADRVDLRITIEDAGPYGDAEPARSAQLAATESSTLLVERSGSDGRVEFAELVDLAPPGTVPPRDFGRDLAGTLEWEC
jgi:hypothetical protein